MAAQGVSALADDERAALGERTLRPDRLSGDQLLLGAEDQEAARQPRRRRSGAARDVREARHSAHEQKMLAGVAVDAIFDSVSVGTTMATSSRSTASSSARSARRCASIPSSSQKYLGSVVPYSDNFFAALNSAVFSRRVVLLRPEGRALPDGAVDVLPHQRGQHRPVRAHADRGRRGRLRELPRGLHRAQARHEPAARRGGRAGRARPRDDQVLDGAELVRRRQGRQGRHLQLRHEARQGAGERARSRGRRSRPARRSRGSIRA